MTSNTWSNYFKELKSQEEGDKALEAFQNATTFNSDIICAITEDENSIILSASSIPNKIKLYHSFHNLGGTRVKPNNKIVALDGFGCLATPTLFDSDSLKKIVKFKTPSYTTLKAITETTSVSSCSAPINGNELEHASFIILPPFIAKFIVNCSSRKSDELLIEMNSLILSFDEDHKDNKEFNKANEFCRNIVKFLWGIYYDKIDPIPTFIDQEDMEIKKWCDSRHSMALVTNESSSNSRISNNDLSFFNELALNVRSQTQVMENIRLDQAESRKNTKAKFEDFHDSCKRLILNASSINRESTKDEPCKTASEFYKKKSVGKASDFLSTTLAQEFKCCTDISTGLVSALFNGNFL